MTARATIGALADELAEVLLRGDPFAASFMAISGYDDAVPDLSPEYQRAWRGRAHRHHRPLRQLRGGPGRYE